MEHVRMIPLLHLFVSCFGTSREAYNGIRLARSVRLDLAPTVHHFGHRSVQFYEYGSITDYSRVTTPFVLTTDREVYDRKIAQLSTSLRMQTLKLQLSIAIFTADEASVSRNYQMVPFTKQLRNLGRKAYYHSVNHVLIVVVSSDHEKNTKLTHDIGFATRFQPTLFQPNPLFALFFQESNSSVSEASLAEEFIIRKGLFACWYCIKASHLTSSPLFEVFEFECGENSGCGESMLLTHGSKINGGRDVHWNFATYERGVGNFDRHESPFGLMAENNTVSVQYAVMSYVRMGLNQSGPMNSRTYCPTLIWITENTFSVGSEIYFSGTQHTYNFITGDGARRVASSYRSIMTPYGYYVWITVLTLPVILVVMAKLTTVIAPPRQPGIQLNTFSILFTYYTALLDQPRNVYRFTFCGTLTASWILCAFILSIEYKSYLKSQFVADVYTVQWTKLEQLRNFTLYVPVRSITQAQLQSKLQTYPSMLLTCMLNDIKECQFHEDLFDYYLQTPCVGDICERLNSARGHVKFLHIDNLRNLLGENLSEPRTALVVPSEEFEYYWTIFKEGMAVNANLRFHHNQHVQDEWAATINYYGAMHLNEFHKHGVPFRMRTVFSSGLHNLWERWSKIHSKFRPSRNAQKNENTGKISYRSPTISSTFNVLLFGLISSSICLVLEKVWRKFRVAEMVGVDGVTGNSLSPANRYMLRFRTGRQRRSK